VNDNNSGGSSPKQPAQRYRCIVAVAVAVLIAAAAAVAGICWTGRCSSPSPVPEPIVPSPVASIQVLPHPMPQPFSQPIPQPVPQPVPVPVSIMPTNTATARANSILPYINSITLSGRKLTYPSNSSAEERAIRWLVEDDLGTAMDDEPSLRQRYVLGTLWFLQTTPTTTGFGSANHTATWTNIDECKWTDVECDDNGHVIYLLLSIVNLQGQIPHDLGLLTELTLLALGDNQLSGTMPSSLGALAALEILDLSRNQISGTIPSSLGALTALWYLDLGDNQLSGTIPSSLVALTALSELLLNDNQLVGTMRICTSEQFFGDLVADCAKVTCTCCTGCCPAAFGDIPAYSLCNT
jgi:hypothetical protein